MGDAVESVGKTKKINIDPSTLTMGGSRGSRRTKGRSSGGVDGTRRTTISRRSKADAKAEVEAKSAAVQEAVMKALMTQPAPPPPPPSDSAPPSHHSPATTSSTHTVAFNSAGNNEPTHTHQPSKSAPRSVNSVRDALHDLNKLIEDRARDRASKTIRAQRRRGEAAYAPTTPLASHSASPSFALTPTSVSTHTLHNQTQLVPNSTAATTNRNQPPWGCLKNGNLPTFREHTRTLRANRKHREKLTESNANVKPPRVHIQTPKEAAAATAANSHSSSSSTLADTVITVGRKDNGRVAFVVGNQGTRRATRAKRGQRSVTNRAKLRKARLLKGGNNAPQHLVDVIAESVDVIGDVVRPEDPSIQIDA